MNRNFFKGIIGDEINVLLSAAAMNFKRRINLWRTEANLCWKLIYQMLLNAYWNLFAPKIKYTF
jgi:transposase, IS5 family